MGEKIEIAGGACWVCVRGLLVLQGVVPRWQRGLLPQSRTGDGADLEEVYNTERHLLYVACTRARDHLLVTGVAPASEFLEDLAS